MPSLKVGLMGCGRIAQLVHLNILRKLPDVDLTALAEPDPEKREEAARRVPGVVALNDYKELLALPEVEAAIICLPNALHAEATIAALEQGKHVYLEKPLATNLRDARRVLAAWRDTVGVVGMIGFNYRFNKLYKLARQHVKSGRLDGLVSVRTAFCTAPRPLPAWKKRRRHGGGVFLDLALHHIDLVHFIFEQTVSEVFAVKRSWRSEDDTAMLQLQLANGLLVHSFFSMNTVDEDCFEIFGEAGKLKLDRYRFLNMEILDTHSDFSPFRQLVRGLRSVITSPYLLKRILKPTLEPSYQKALAHFVGAVRTNKKASPDFTDGYRSLAIIEAAEESTKSCRVISLCDRDHENFDSK